MPGFLRRDDGDFVLRVRGDSMIGAGIFDADLIVVHPQPDARDGEIVVARVAGVGDDEATAKRFYRDGRHRAPRRRERELRADRRQRRPGGTRRPSRGGPSPAMSTVPLATVAQSSSPTPSTSHSPPRSPAATSPACGAEATPCASSRADLWSGAVTVSCPDVRQRAQRRRAAPPAGGASVTERVPPARRSRDARVRRPLGRAPASRVPSAGPAGVSGAGAVWPACSASPCSSCSSSWPCGPASASPTPATTPAIYTRHARTPCAAGDDLWTIAASEYGADVDLRAAVYAIREANDLETSGLQPGQSLTLPYLGRVTRRLGAGAATQRPTCRGAMLRYTCAASGTWRSLVAHLLWEQGVASSNLAVPTKPYAGGSSSVGRASAFQAEGRGFETRLPLHLLVLPSRILAFPRARSSAG